MTRELNAAGGGDPQTLDAAFRALHAELRRMARARLRGQVGHASVESMDLVQDLCVRFLGSVGRRDWSSREHFLAWAARVMHNLVRDHARARQRDCRRAPGQRLFLDEVADHIAAAGGGETKYLEATERLERERPRTALVVFHHFVLGCTVDETAATLAMAKRTVERELKRAREMLWREVQ